METTDVLKVVERWAEVLRVAIAAEEAGGENERLAAEVDRLKLQKDKLVETVKSLELRIAERQRVVDEYEGKFGRITRLQDLDRTIATAELRLRTANQELDGIPKSARIGCGARDRWHAGVTEPQPEEGKNT